MTTEDALHAALDLDPSDAVTRLVLSDWLLGEGRDDEAAGQRWLAGAGKWPFFSPQPYGAFYWDWFRPSHLPKDEHDSRPEWWTSCVPDSLYDRLRDGAAYTTRREAEDDLVRAARDAGLVPPL
jgi:uncharacterized protein (TIGR02996 family)